MPPVARFVLVGVAVALGGCRFNVGAIADPDGGPRGDGAVTADRDDGGALQTDAARADGALDAAAGDAALADATPLDGAADPCQGLICLDDNPCTQDLCVGGVCRHDLLTGTLCETGKVCLNGSCVSCGEQNEPCCPGGGCASGYGCNGSFMCEQCGDEGETCCSGSPACDPGLKCAATTCAPCGAEYQTCCDTAPACGDGLGCGPVTNLCRSCGSSTQPCCASGSPCHSGHYCVGGVCT